MNVAVRPNVLEKFRLDGRTALVTGGAGLLGREFVRTLAEAGATVTAADLNGPELANVTASLRDRGLAVAGVEADVTSPDSVRAVVSATAEPNGRVDILVNAAAINPGFSHGRKHDGGTFESLSLESWNAALAVNLTGVFLCSQAAVSVMRRQDAGTIINLCSTYGLVGPDQRIYRRPGEPAAFKPVQYSVTKAGVLGFTRYLATYVAGTRIRVNALTPGGVFDGHVDPFLSAYSARTVLGRMAEPDEMNGALLFLASDASSYMTGANMIVDGGWTAW